VHVLFRSALIAAVVACALAPAAASAATSSPGTATLAKLAPLPGHTERGLVQLFVRPKASSVTAAVAPYDEGDTATHFTVALSKRRCRGVASHPGNPGWIGETEKNLFDPKPIQGFYLDDFAIGAVPPRNVRAARSMVLLVADGGGKLGPRACGNTRTVSLAKAPFKPRRPSVLVGLLLPFARHSERANVQLTVRPGSASLALVGDFNGDGDVSYSLRLSRRSCAAIKSNPANPGYIGPPLIAPTAFTGATFVNNGTASASKAGAHAARSIVLVGRGAGGRFQPRSCGLGIELEEILISN
jgi:hypothetical protein